MGCTAHGCTALANPSVVAPVVATIDCNTQATTTSPQPPNPTSLHKAASIEYEDDLGCMSDDIQGGSDETFLMKPF